VKLNCVLSHSRHSLVYNKYFTDALNNSECRTTCPADLHSSMRSDVTSCPMTRQYVRRTGAYTCVTVPSSTHGSQTTSVLAVCSIERSKTLIGLKREEETKWWIYILIESKKSTILRISFICISVFSGFTALAPAVWNSLNTDILCCSSLALCLLTSCGLVADLLSPVHTVAEKCNCCRQVRLSPNSATVAVVSPFSATVALFCDSVDRALGGSRQLVTDLLRGNVCNGFRL